MLDMCHQCKRLEALIYVSTAYANCDKEEIAERIYAPNVDPRHLINIAGWMDDDVIQSITPQSVPFDLFLLHFERGCLFNFASNSLPTWRVA